MTAFDFNDTCLQWSTLAIVGSSNAAGMGASTYASDPDASSGWRSPETSWAGLLSKYLYDINTFNFSVSGADSDWAVGRLPAIYSEFSPSSIFMCTNPISDDDGFDNYLKNCYIFIDYCKSRMIVPIIRGGYAYNGYTKSIYREVLLLNQNISNLDCIYIDGMTNISDNGGSYIDGDKYHTDGLHPSDDGHKIFYQNTVKSLSVYMTN